MNVDEMISGTRRGIGLFEMAHRGLLEVRGEDRVRWLDGMISGDVQALENEGSSSGCYAVLLTSRGAIVADLHVGRIEDSYYLESLRSEIPRIRETLERYIIADDVELIDRSGEMVAIGLEGPQSARLLAEVAATETAGIQEDDWIRTSIAGRDALIAAFGFTGEQAFQIRMKPEDRETIESALLDGTGEDGLVRGSLEALEVMRVEAGIPVLGAELDEEVLPPEARLERAISTTKGCYVGQEIVARLRARGQVNHLLVGLRIELTDTGSADGSLPADGSSPADGSLPADGSTSIADLPPVEAPLSSGGRVTGELTSVVCSPTEGPIGLGYVRREHSEIGTVVAFEGGRATVVELPFVVLAPRGDRSPEIVATTNTEGADDAPRDSMDERESS